LNGYNLGTIPTDSLGCTEIGLLIKQTDTQIPLYDTTDIHSNSAVEYALLTG